MRILVTGGAGFIGSHIVQNFQGKAEVRVLDNLRTGHRENLDGFKVDFIEGDILDKAVVAKAVEGVDYVFHLAAMVSVPESMDHPHEAVKINVEGILNVLEASAAAGVKKLCHSSTCAIYGDNPEFPKRESMIPQPMSPYAVTKLDGEFYCDIFTQTGKLKTACMRYFNVFGPRQDPNSAYAAAIPIFTSKAVANEPISVYGDGEQTRDFIYVKDIVAANVHMAMNDCSGVYNVAYGGRITINDLITKIKNILGSESEVQYLPERPGEVKHSMASVDKLAATGFVPQSNFEAGLEATIDYFKNLVK